MTSTDYSQSGEQALILGAIKDLPTGRFLDIGAGDGETFSNTRHLALTGWGGVCVEPAAWAFEKLVDLYADTFIGVCSAIVTADYCGPMTFLYSRGDHLSTVEPAEAAKWKQVEFRNTVVGAVTLAQVLDWFELGASVVSIDAEGRTNEIVRAYMQHVAWQSVQVICFEHEYRDILALPVGFDLVAETPNNAIARRR